MINNLVRSMTTLYSNALIHNEVLNLLGSGLNNQITNKIQNPKRLKSECSGSIYVLEHPYDSNMFKVGRTSGDPNIRAAQWGYKKLWAEFTQTNVRTEQLAHLYLNNFHQIIPSINGKGKTEVEWFNIPFNVLILVLKSILITQNDLNADVISSKELESFNLLKRLVNYRSDNELNNDKYIETLQKWSIKDIKRIHGIGEQIAPRIYKCLKNNPNIQNINQLSDKKSPYKINGFANGKRDNIIRYINLLIAQ